ncbi:MAG: hypothetical protein GX567_16490, partial [Clostridia bacterium]|nr:hypothetical protein [Clostridia bacterium]
FGKRRAYQRKVGIAPFDGIFSAHGFVFRANRDVIDENLLPYFIQSDQFMNRAIEISVGSLSPTINWSELKKQVFVLPSIEEQRKIVETISAADEVSKRYVKEFNDLSRLKLKYEDINFLLHEVIKKNPSIPKNWRIGYVTDLVEIDPRFPKGIETDTVSFVPMDLIDENGNIVEQRIEPLEKVKKGYTYFAEGDILFAKITPCMENGKGTLATNLLNGIGFGSTEFYVIRPYDKNDTQYLYSLSMSKVFRRRAERWMQGSAGQRRVPKDFFSKRLIAIPPEKERQRIGEMFREIDYNLFLLKEQINKSRKLTNNLLNTYLDVGGAN